MSTKTDKFRNPSCPSCGSTMIGYSLDESDDLNKNNVNWVCSRSPDCRGFIRAETKNNKKVVSSNKIKHTKTTYSKRF